MSMATSADTYRLPINPATRRSPGWWVMVLVVVTEAMFFAYLLFGYAYLASVSTAAWPPRGAPEMTLALPNTAVLLASSATMWRAERGIAQGRPHRLCLWLLATFVLGAAFLTVQGVEYGRKTFTPQSGAYGSLFYTITGFHGAHVFVGLLMNVLVQLRAWRGHFTAERHLAVINTALYWHFVDAVWVAVFVTLYVAPRLA
jgi:heme/copper-type cytochrome/quinol oxidase subunit 3